MLWESVKNTLCPIYANYNEENWWSLDFFSNKFIEAFQTRKVMEFPPPPPPKKKKKKKKNVNVLQSANRTVKTLLDGFIIDLSWSFTWISIIQNLL